LHETAQSRNFEPCAETNRILPGFKALTEMPDLPIRIPGIASATPDLVVFFIRL
jgi:hypothetical protein